MNTFKTRTLAAALLVTLLAGAAYAGSGPRVDPNPQARAEKLATVPGLTQAQRDDIIRIEDESRAAQRALMERTRSEHEQLRDEANRKLRSALGDKGYADYVSWRLEQRGEHRHDRREHRHERMGKRSRGDAKADMTAPAGE